MGTAETDAGWPVVATDGGLMPARPAVKEKGANKNWLLGGATLWAVAFYAVLPRPIHPMPGLRVDNPAGIEARVRNGVVHLRLPKAGPAKLQRIEVRAD